MRRVYRTKNWVKAFWIFFLAFSLFFSVGILRGISTGKNSWFELAIAIVLVVAGVGGAMETLTARVVLSDDSLSQGSVFRSRSIRLDQVSYRREYVEYHDAPDGGTNVYYLELVSREPDLDSLKIEKDQFDFDRMFWDWVYRIPEIEELKP